MNYYLTQEMLDEAFEIRDRQIERVRLATETRRRIVQAKSQEEYDSIHLPEEFQKYGEYGYQFMAPYISGYSLEDKDAVKCYYGALGGPASLLIPTLFRGEIKDYGETSGYSSLGRTLMKIGNDDTDLNKYTALLVAQMRIEIFAGFLSNFKQFREFPFAKPRPELIAQHYGLNTQFLDLTDDVKVAMFFACCKHIGNNVFAPITDKDILEMGENGVLYRGIAEIPCIGCQPFCRCHRQRGYYLDTTIGGKCWKYSLSVDKNFNKFFFKRTVELSNKLFEEFNGGSVLFPQDELSLFDEQIKAIKETKIFPFEVFEDQFSSFSKFLQKIHSVGLIDSSLFSSLSNKTYVKSALEAEGHCFQEKIHIKLSENQKTNLQELNAEWNPARFAEDDGIVYSPFIVCYD